MNLLKHRSMRFYLAFFLILTMAIGGSAIAAFADSGGATATLTGQNSVTETGTFGNNTAFTVNLSGTDQMKQYTVPITVTDATGSGLGWNLQISGSALSDGNIAHPQLPQSFISATGQCTGQGTCTNIHSTTTYTTFTIGGSPAKFFEADANSGMGIFTVTPTIQITVPGNAYAGVYQGSITLASVSTP